MMDILNKIDWLNISSNVVAVGLLLWAAIKLYAKTVIEETVKNEFAKSLAEFKSDLDKKNITYQVDYSFYNTEQSKVCIELHRKLSHFSNTAHSVTFRLLHSDYKVNAEFKRLKDELNKAWEDLYTYHDDNRILLPEDFSFRVYDFYDLLMQNSSRFMLEYESGKPLDGDKDSIEALQSLYDRISKSYSKWSTFGSELRKMIEPESNQNDKEQNAIYRRLQW